MRYPIIIFAVALFLGSISYVSAAPTSSILRTILPETTSTYDLGSATKMWNKLYTDGICIGVDCKTAWPASSSGTVSTSTALTSGQVAVATGVDTIGSYATFLFDSALAKLTVTNASTTALSIGSLTGILKQSGGVVVDAVADTDYQVPLTFGDGLTRTVNDVDCDTASGSVFGCLASADWTTFNAKQAAGNYITALTGDVTASGPGSAAATLATVNGNVGSFGSATQTGTFTVNGKGLITAASNTTVTPAVGSITGLGTGVATALGVNVGSAGAFVTFNGALGTPSSATLTNATGLLPAGINLTKGNFLVGNDAGIAQATSTIFISSTGNVGIGETSPGTYGTLEVKSAAAASTIAPGNLGLMDSTAQAAGTGGMLVFGGKYTDAGAYTTGGWIRASKTNATTGNYSFDMTFGTRVNGSGAMAEVLRLSSTGNVGIAEGNTPTQALSIYRAGATAAYTSYGNSAVGLNGSLFGVDTSGNTVISNTQALPILLSTNGVERVRILSDGNVGIGTTTPGGLLHIAETSTAGNTFIVEANGASAVGAGIRLRHARGTVAAPTNIVAGDTTGFIAGQAYTGGTWASTAEIDFLTESTAFTSGLRPASAISFYTNPADGSQTERMRITSAGKVGIGSTNPASTLDLGTGTNGRGIAWGGSASEGNYANIYAPYSTSGIVLATGFRGSTSADSYLSSYGSSMRRSGLRLNAFNDDGIQFFSDTAATIAENAAYTPTERMRITPSGNVGVGTTGPSQKLHINGNLLVDSFARGDDTGIFFRDGFTHNVSLSVRDWGSSNVSSDGLLMSGYDGIGFMTSENTYNAANIRLFIQGGGGASAGYVGIGTTTPGTILSIGSTTSFINLSHTATSTFAFGLKAPTAYFSGLVEFVGNVIAQAGAILDFSAATVKTHEYSSFTYATSTAWTATTTIPLGPAATAESWDDVMCFTDTGTLNVSIYDGTNRMNMFNASTTVGTVDLSTNNTFTVAEKRYVDVGTPASTPTKISCTVDRIVNN